MLRILPLVVMAAFVGPIRCNTMDFLMDLPPNLNRRCGIIPFGPELDPYTKLDMGGSVAIFDQIPWHVGIFFRPDNTHLCSGVLISKHHVLTSAFCLMAIEIDSDIEIRLGDWNIRDNETTFPESHPFVSRSIKTLVNYPTRTRRNDQDVKNKTPLLTLLKMNESVDLGRYPFISPICLPELTDVMKEDPKRKCYVSGWGYNQPEEEDPLEAREREELRFRIQNPQSPFGSKSRFDDFFHTSGFYHTQDFFLDNEQPDEYDIYGNVPAVNVAELIPRKYLDAMAYELGVWTSPWVGVYLNVPALDEDPKDRAPRKYETVEDFNPPMDAFPYTKNIVNITAKAVQKILDYYPKPFGDDIGDKRLFHIFWEDPQPNRDLADEFRRLMTARRIAKFDAQDMFYWPDSIRLTAQLEGPYYRQKEKYKEGKMGMNSKRVIRIRKDQEKAIYQLKNYIRAKVVERLMPVGFKPRKLHADDAKLDFNQRGLSPYLKWQDVNFQGDCKEFPKSKANLDPLGKTCVVPISKDERHAANICVADIGSPVVCMENPEDVYAKRWINGTRNHWTKSDLAIQSYLGGIVTWKRPCYTEYNETKQNLNLTLVSKSNENFMTFLLNYMDPPPRKSKQRRRRSKPLVIAN